MAKILGQSCLTRRQPLMMHDTNRPPSPQILSDKEYPPSSLTLPIADAIGRIQSTKFTQLKDLVEHTTVNIVGVIASFKEVTRAAHGRRDFTSCLTLCDPTRSLIGTGLLCFFYNPRQVELPQPLRTGEILIAYDLRIRPHGHDIQAWSTHTTRFKLVAPGFDLRTLRPDEYSMVKEMHEWWSARGGTPGAKGDIIKRDKEGQIVNEEGPYKSKKMSHVGGMEINHFYDIICEVVKVFPGYPHTLYVTDYTQNTSLFSYAWSAGQTQWKGPFGKYTLQLTCWGTVADYAKACKDGGYYLFKNVRAKRNRDGNLEGSLNPDQKHQEKVMIERMDMESAAVKAILKRKKEYLIRFENSIKSHAIAEAAARKRMREELPSDDDQLESTQPQYPKRKRSKQTLVEEEIVAPKISRYIQSAYPNVPPVTIKQIISTNKDSLKPRKMRIVCRVKEYYPQSIADFVAAWCTLCQNTWRTSESPTCPECNVPPSSAPDESAYKWEFNLLLEDVNGDTLPIIVADEDAEQLLQLQADNLHENRKLLEQLRQKLFILWGPLEESSSPSPPKSIRKHLGQSTKRVSVRFSDEICYDDDSSSSLDARYPTSWDENDRGGGKIVKTRSRGRLGSDEIKAGIWFEASIKEFWVRQSEADFGVRRWRLFGTKIV